MRDVSEYALSCMKLQTLRCGSVGAVKGQARGHTFASRSAVELMAAKVLSQLMPLRLISPSLAGSPCTVLPNPSPAERKLSVAMGENKAPMRPLLLIRSPHTSMPRAFRVCSHTCTAGTAFYKAFWTHKDTAVMDVSACCFRPQVCELGVQAIIGC